MSKKKRAIPLFTRPLIETHCHLDYLEELPLEEILQKSLANNIEKIITIAVEPKNLGIVRALAQKYAPVFCTQGVHPHQAKLWSAEVEKEINQYAGQGGGHKIVAIGEIGLDFYYDHSPRKKQKEVFSKQMEMAAHLNLPVIIHAREADRETIKLIEEWTPHLKRKGVIHSFTAGPELAEKALEQGFFLGFNGIITFKNAENVREVAKLCPLERILLETDAPFLTPIPYRGQENAPYYLPLVAEKMSQLKEVGIEEILEKTTANAKKLFQFH